MFICFVGRQYCILYGLTVMNVYNWALDFISVIFELFSKNVINENYLDKYKKKQLTKLGVAFEVCFRIFGIYKCMIINRNVK